VQLKVELHSQVEPNVGRKRAITYTLQLAINNQKINSDFALANNRKIFESMYKSNQNSP